jgi:hypothetical protein
MAKRKSGAGRRGPAAPAAAPPIHHGIHHSARFFGAFIIDVALGGVAFLTLLLIEGLIGIGVHALASLFGDGLLMRVMGWVHDGVILVDAGLFLWFVVISALRTGKEHR